MAEVATVYTIAPHVRRPDDIVRSIAPHHERDETTPPNPEYKRVWASLVKTPHVVLRRRLNQ